MINSVIQGNSLEILKELEENSIDCIATDPPYGYSFMGKDWDKALPDINIFKECFRVLKHGCFAFVMSAPRSDVLSRMIILLEDSGFNVAFTPIFWAYASGFPKAMNISKQIDKRLGKKRKQVEATGSLDKNSNLNDDGWNKIGMDKPLMDCNEPASDEAKALNGSYAGFQPKPAVEVVIVAMKPLSEKNYTSQALCDGKGVTWLDDCRIPYKNENDLKVAHYNAKGMERLKKDHGEKLGTSFEGGWNKHKPTLRNDGRFPANLLCCDDVLNDGNNRVSNIRAISKTEKTNKDYRESSVYGKYKENVKERGYNDSGSYSRYFDLDAWFNELPENIQKTFPFMIVPKASKSEKNKGIEKNNHPTVKPIKLMTYLITLGSRPKDTILDPFAGSGTTCISAKMLGRNYIGIELEPEYKIIADARLNAVEKPQPTLTAF